MIQEAVDTLGKETRLILDLCVGMKADEWRWSSIRRPGMVHTCNSVHIDFQHLGGRNGRIRSSSPLSATWKV